MVQFPSEHRVADGLGPQLAGLVCLGIEVHQRAEFHGGGIALRGRATKERERDLRRTRHVATTARASGTEVRSLRGGNRIGGTGQLLLAFAQHRAGLDSHIRRVLGTFGPAAE